MSLWTACLATAAIALTPAWIASAWFGYSVYRDVAPCPEPPSALFSYNRPELQVTREREERALAALRARARSDRRAARELERRLARKIECAESDLAVATVLLRAQTPDERPWETADYMAHLEDNLPQWTAEVASLRSARARRGNRGGGSEQQPSGPVS